MATHTVTTLANLIPNLWSRRVRAALESKLIAGKRVLRLDDEVSKGKTLYVPAIANISATSVSAGGSYTSTQNTEGVTTLNINQHYVTAISVDDIAKIQASYDLFSLYSGKLVYGVALQFETGVLDLYSGLSQQVGASGVPFADDPYLNCIQFLDESDSDEEDRTFMARPASKRTISKLDKFVDVSKMGMVGKGPVVTGLFGEIYGIPVFFSNVVPSSAGIHNLVFWKEAFVAGIQKDISVENFGRTGQTLTQDLVCQGIWGHAEHRDTSAVDFLT